MSRLRPGLLLSSLLTLLISTAAGGQPLIGDPVPDLGESLDWPLGEPVPAFADGSVYLIDFWATWCPPCYPMIDQLTDLQRHHREAGLVVIGVAVGTDVGLPLATFLEREFERIGYRIATSKDDLALQRQLIHPELMDPTDLALPFVMLVDREGRLAWVSDPGSPVGEQHDALEKAVTSLLDGSFDLDAEIARHRESREGREGIAELLAEADSLRREGRPTEATLPLLEAARRQPRQAAEAAISLFQELLCLSHTDEASSYGRELLRTPIGERVSELVVMERSILSLGDAEGRDLQLAEAIGHRALELQGGEHPDFLFELAKILAASDDPRAESLRLRAVEAATAQGWDAGYIRFIDRVGLTTALRQQASAFATTCDPYEEAGSAQLEPRAEPLLRQAGEGDRGIRPARELSKRRARGLRRLDARTPILRNLTLDPADRNRPTPPRKEFR